MNSPTSQLGSIFILTLQVSGTAVLISTLIGVPLGVWMGLTRFRAKRVATALVHTGMALPPVVVGLLLYIILSRSGPLSGWGWLFTPQAMILAQTILDLPFVVGITMAAIAAVPTELSWQLRSIGATPRQARREIVREARGGIILAISTAFGRSLSEVGAVWLVGGNIAGQTRVLTTAIVLETGQGNFTVALILGGILLGVALSINLVILRYQGRPLP
ncbi:MAG: ABC transporter permease [Planctomycetaceae bacterium]